MDPALDNGGHLFLVVILSPIQIPDLVGCGLGLAEGVRIWVLDPGLGTNPGCGSVRPPAGLGAARWSLESRA